MDVAFTSLGSVLGGARVAKVPPWRQHGYPPLDFRTWVRVYGAGVRAGEAARRAGVNAATLRYYERRGLLPEPARTPSGHRHYDEDAVRFLRAIKEAQAGDAGVDLVDLRRGPGPQRLGGGAAPGDA